MSVDQLTQVGQQVRRFYEECSFPGYEAFDTPSDLVEKARRGLYANLLDEQLPLGITILDAGCGTGQLATFLSLTNRRVVGIDFSFNSLKRGQDFKQRFGLKDVRFVQMNLFHLGLREESFDYVFCNGVLHHTADAYQGFQALSRLVKKGGYFILGLYNTYGRVMLNFRKVFFRLINGKLRRLDFFVRQRSLGEQKKQIWYMDQYEHPHEDAFSVDEVLGWFARNGLQYVNAVPKITFAEPLTAAERLFEPRRPGTTFDHLLCQLGWIFTKGHEGGFFIMIGRKPA